MNILLSFLFCFSALAYDGLTPRFNKVGAGVVSIDASAIVQLDSTVNGILIPRMTQAQRDAIAAPATGLLVYNTDTHALSRYNGVSWADIGGGGTGDVVGPASASDNALARFDTTTGKLIQNSTAILSDTGEIAGLIRADIGNIRIESNTISATNTNGHLVLDPDGTGQVEVPYLTASLPVKTDASSRLVTGAINLATAEVTGVLTVPNGGTGVATIPANSVILGNGTNTIISVAPGTSGNVLTSNGTTWTSAPGGGGGGNFDANLINGRTVPLWDWSAPVKLANPSTLPVSNSYGGAWSPSGRFVAVPFEGGSPYIYIYEVSDTTFTPLSNPAILPAGASYVADWSPDERFLAVGHDTSPFITIYERNGSTFTKLTNPATLPAASVFRLAFSPSGRFLAAAHPTSPFITIYERSGTTFTKLTNPATLPTGTGQSVSWSPDETMLVVGHTSSPFITIYERSGTTFTKLADPATLPGGTALGVAFSPGGDFLAVSDFSLSPYVHIYTVSGTTFTKLADPVDIPTGLGYGVSWSPSGEFLTVTHFTSPYILTYQRSGTTFTKIADPVTLPAGNSRRNNWSLDGKFLLVSHSNSPFMTIYRTASPEPTVTGAPNILFQIGDQADW